MKSYWPDAIAVPDPVRYANSDTPNHSTDAGCYAIPAG
jgi:hypothetical protein